MICPIGDCDHEISKVDFYLIVYADKIEITYKCPECQYEAIVEFNKYDLSPTFRT